MLLRRVAAHFAFTVGIMFAVAPAAHGQKRPDLRASALEIVKAARYATMVTNGIDGQPQARIVDPLVESSLQTLWVATNPQSRKVKELRRDARVTLLFFNQARGEYVTVLARAHAITDAAEVARHWKQEWTPFYPGGAASSRVVLYAIHPFQLEVVSPARGIASDSATWRPAIERLP